MNLNMKEHTKQEKKPNVDPRDIPRINFFLITSGVVGVGSVVSTGISAANHGYSRGEILVTVASVGALGIGQTALLFFWLVRQLAKMRKKEEESE